MNSDEYNEFCQPPFGHDEHADTPPCEAAPMLFHGSVKRELMIRHDFKDWTDLYLYECIKRDCGTSIVEQVSEDIAHAISTGADLHTTITY